MEYGSLGHCRSSEFASISGRHSVSCQLRAKCLKGSIGRVNEPVKQNWTRETNQKEMTLPRGLKTKQKYRLQAALTEAVNANDVEAFPRGSHWQVHKFGGTCLADAERIGNAAAHIVEVLKASGDQQMVVVSAMGSIKTSPVKVTDLLLQMVAKAARQDQAFLIDLAALQEKHVETAKLLLGNGPALNKFVDRLLDDMANLKAMLKAISIAGMVTDVFSDFVVGHGELWSANLFSLAVQKHGTSCKYMDTRDVMIVTSPDGKLVDIEYQESDDRLDMWARKNGVPEVIVATGFIAKNPQGQVTTLKRNGSDYSATIMGALVRGSHITIWTDVDGVFSADPRKVSEAQCLSSLSYHEAWELSYFGASVLHPRTTMPAMKYNIPITIRNFFNKANPGTEICTAKSDIEKDRRVLAKGFATIDHVALINVEGTGMVGVHGTASDIFTSVRDAGVNVIMISQASSEHSVCFAVNQSDGDQAVSALNKRFEEAIKAGRISKVEKIDECCVLAAVGHQMASRKGVAATMFSALANANVNIRCIAQGCSEYNITVLVDQKESVRALRAVHGRFYLATLPLGIGIVGAGEIGKTFLAQIHSQMKELREDFGIDVGIYGIAKSRKMLLSHSPINLETWEDVLDRDAEANDLTSFGDHMANTPVPNSVIIDATASDWPAQKYLEWMKKGIHVITPNKKLNSGSLDQYRKLKQFQRDAYIHFMYEATVGAGLPVIATLQHLVRTGDRIERVEGVFSGTLSYIFNNLTVGTKFSEIVTVAKKDGYTEPDPRDDLAGMDVARKVTIIARECGIEMELSDIAVRNLVPEPLRDVESVPEFMEKLPEYDSDISSLVEEADAAGECLRFVGAVDVKSGKGSVELKSFPLSHPFATLEGTDNIISFTTTRYKHQPLIVRGPGAGKEVTAGGVFSDLLRLAAHLGSPS